MNKEELSEKLNKLNLQYPTRIPKDILSDAAENQLVIVYGLSDDIMRFAGAINDEVDCYGDGAAHIINGVLAFSECSDGEDCPYFKEKKLEAIKIDAIWDEDEIAWQYKTSIPHSKFPVWEDGEEHCRGIVFSLDELDYANLAPEPNTAEPIFIPYCPHTAGEMVPIFIEIYRTAEGARFEFIMACRKSADPRVSTMNSFARDVCFEMTKAIFQGKDSLLCKCFSL